MVFLLLARLMVGHLPLEEGIGVRIPGQQQRTIRCTASPKKRKPDGSVRCAVWHVSRITIILVMKFYYVYILKSLRKDFIYVGQTTDLKRRFKEHNNKEELSTKHYAPFELIFYEAYRNRKDSLRREEYLKTTKGKTTPRSMLKEYLKN